ncbi:hypothetical protein D3C80_1582760 [compost metagenome]
MQRLQGDLLRLGKLLERCAHVDLVESVHGSAIARLRAADVVGLGSFEVGGHPLLTTSVYQPEIVVRIADTALRSPLQQCQSFIHVLWNAVDAVEGHESQASAGTRFPPARVGGYAYAEKVGLTQHVGCQLAAVFITVPGKLQSQREVFRCRIWAVQ